MHRPADRCTRNQPMLCPGRVGVWVGFILSQPAAEALCCCLRPLRRKRRGWARTAVAAPATAAASTARNRAYTGFYGPRAAAALSGAHRRAIQQCIGSCSRCAAVSTPHTPASPPRSLEPYRPMPLQDVLPRHPRAPHAHCKSRTSAMNTLRARARSITGKCLIHCLILPNFCLIQL